MDLFYSSGGRANPDFLHKVRIKRSAGSQSISDMMEWCDNYPTVGSGSFQRYYLNFRDDNDQFASDCVTFQFEWEEPAILFALKFGAA